MVFKAWIWCNSCNHGRWTGNVRETDRLHNGGKHVTLGGWTCDIKGKQKGDIRGFTGDIRRDGQMKLGGIDR